VSSIDVTTCPCGGRLTIVEVVVDPDAIALHLHGANTFAGSSSTTRICAGDSSAASSEISASFLTPRTELPPSAQPIGLTASC
jgi:hypothetical protein